MAQLFPKYAPRMAENFVKLAERNYYDDIIFYQAIPDFMIQGGDPTRAGRGGEGIYGHPFGDKFSEESFNFAGALSMVNTGPNINGNQSFIITNEHVPEDMIDQVKAVGYPQEIIDYYEKYGDTPWFDFHHTAFGQVSSGMDVVEKISKIKRGTMDKPGKGVVIRTIKTEKEE